MTYITRIANKRILAKYFLYSLQINYLQWKLSASRSIFSCYAIYIYIANIFTDYIESAQSVETSHGAHDRNPIGEAQDTAAEPDCCSTGTGDGCSETTANATVLRYIQVYFIFTIQ